MSSEHTPMSEFERRYAVKRLGITQAQIAEATGFTQGHISQVISGRYRTWPVMTYIAEMLNLPLEIVFPGAERRKSQGERAA